MASENQKENYILKYNELLNIILTTHDSLKIKVNTLYMYAVKHGVEYGDWSLFGDFINKMTNAKILTPLHCKNILTNTNPNLIYDLSKKSVRQGKDFNKSETHILESLWIDSLTGKTKKDMQVVFNDMSLKKSLLNIINKALKNNFDKEKIKTIFANAIDS